MNQPAPQGHGQGESYARKYFDASPTWFAWNKLTATDINRLRRERGFEGQNVYFHLNHPLRFVDVVGLVVQIDLIYDKYTLLQLDDSSGSLIEIKLALRQKRDTDVVAYPSNTEVDNVDVKIFMGLATVLVDQHEIDVGSIIRVKGELCCFRSHMQVQPKRVSIIKSTNEEVMHWSKVADFKRDVLSKPWVLERRERIAIEEALSKAAAKDRARREGRRAHNAKHEERKRRHLAKAEARRVKAQQCMDAGALPGTDRVPAPWE